MYTSIHDCTTDFVGEKKGWIRNQKPGGSKLWDQRSGAKFQGRYYLVDLRPRNGPKSAQYRWKTQKGKQRIKGKRYLLKNNDSNGKTRRTIKLTQRLFVAESVFCFCSQQCAHLLTSYKYLVNLSISVFVRRAYALDKCITIN